MGTQIQLGKLLKPLSNFTAKQLFNSFPTLALHQSQEQYHPTMKRRSKKRELAILLQFPITQNPISQYKKVHSQVVVLGFQHDVFLTNLLLHSYSKWDHMDDARKLFDRMPEKSLISWCSMLSVYARHNYNEEALVVFSQFRRSCSDNPNEYIFASLMRACTQLGGIHRGSQVHCFVVKSGFLQDVYVGTSLIDFYAKHGDMDKARLVFDGLEAKNSFTWSAIMMGYIKSGRMEESFNLFNQMRETGIVPDRYVLSSALNACSMLEFIEGGKQIHAYVLRRGVEMDVIMMNIFIDFYSKCQKVKIGRKLFDHMRDRNLISWTTMIAGYMQNSFDFEAMDLFVEMFRWGLLPDAFACTSILTSCGSLESLEKGRQVHAYTIKTNLENDDFVKNGSIDMYAKCDSLSDAREVFDAMAITDVVSYNAMIEGYSSRGKLCEAVDLFNEMRVKLLHPNLLTFVSLFGLSASVCSLELSKQVHCLIIKYGISLKIFAGSALVDVYSKCSCVRDARLVFDEMEEKDIVVWNAMFSGYNLQLENEETLKLYKSLQASGERPSEYTFSSLITAASNLASLMHGQQFHNQTIKMGIESDLFVTNSLVDMYAKCGNIEDSCKAFTSTDWTDVVSWNSIISTYANHGAPEKAIETFEVMIKKGIKPNYVTFVGVLSACSHSGLVDLGLCHFESMARFGLEPGVEHYASIVSLLGRAGKLFEAKQFIEAMPIKPAATVWRSLLSACRNAGNVELGRYAADMAISSDPEDSGSYTLLSNIFASKGMWLDVNKVREKMDINKVVKEPGCSWIEVCNGVHIFVARDTTHADAELIRSILDNLILHLKGFGYVPDTNTLLIND